MSLQSDSEQSVLRTLSVIGTAYTANCKGCSGITKEGINLHENHNMNIIAVDPNVIPLGSIVRLTSESYPDINGIYLAADTGGAIKGNRIDIFEPSLTEAKNIGVRNDITVEVLREGY